MSDEEHFSIYPAARYLETSCAEMSDEMGSIRQQSLYNDASTHHFISSQLILSTCSGVTTLQCNGRSTHSDAVARTTFAALNAQR